MRSVWIIGGALALFALYMAGVDRRWLAAFGVAWLGLTFNSIVHVKTQADAAFGTVQAMLMKRCDLIPGLVDAAQRYMDHESEVLREVVGLRARTPGGSFDVREANDLDAAAAGSLGRLLATVERYPQLQADESFQHLQRSLAEVEEQLSAARRTYNMTVKHYNDSLGMFPTNLFAAVLRFPRREYFAAPEANQAPVDVMGRFRAHRDAA